jgi:hypothetical protein
VAKPRDPLPHTRRDPLARRSRRGVEHPRCASPTAHRNASTSDGQPGSQTQAIKGFNEAIDSVRAGLPGEIAHRRLADGARKPLGKGRAGDGQLFRSSIAAQAGRAATLANAREQDHAFPAAHAFAAGGCEARLGHELRRSARRRIRPSAD